MRENADRGGRGGNAPSGAQPTGTPPCAPTDVALKSFFLGPQAENAPWVKDLLVSLLDRWFAWRRSVFPADGAAIAAADQCSPEFTARRLRFGRELDLLVERFEKEVPKFSPRYIGHMFSETSLPALFGHILTLLHNPNNISGESSRVGIGIEREAIAALAAMVGFEPAAARGHFTSGGTVANIEAMIRARKRLARWLALGAIARATRPAPRFLFTAAHMGWENADRLLMDLPETEVPGALAEWEIYGRQPSRSAERLARLFKVDHIEPRILVPGHAHYSWAKGASLLGLGDDAIRPVALDRGARLSSRNLYEELRRASQAQRPILMIVSVAGSTETGNLDPIHEVNEMLRTLRAREGLEIWHHVDAAYGGFFCSLKASQPGALSAESLLALRGLAEANSVTLDPHKLGYVPYASGAFLCADRREYELPTVDAPYISFDEGDPGVHTLEGSRSAAGAVATHLTASTIGLDAGGYGRILERTILDRRRLEAALREGVPSIRIFPAHDSNILCFCVAAYGESYALSNLRTLDLYRAFGPRNGRDFVVSKTDLRHSIYGDCLRAFAREWNAEADADHLSMIRVCLMNPFFGSKESKVDYLQQFVNAVRAALRGEAAANPGKETR